jgi:Na+/H+ antiporter NhaD/arsenite permease-like protein
LPHPQINHPRTLALGGVIMFGVLLFFVVGEMLPFSIEPATVALLGGALALLLAHQSRIETVNHILQDIDWNTLIFFMSFFVLIGGLEETGLINQLGSLMANTLGNNMILASIIIVFVTGVTSSLVPNIPLAVTMLPLLKRYCVDIGVISPEMMQPDYQGQFPTMVLPLFYAMMLGTTLGGNGTLLGASSNIVAAGIAEQHGKKISFTRFLKYGIPVAVAQLVVSAFYVVIRFFILKV